MIINVACRADTVELGEPHELIGERPGDPDLDLPICSYRCPAIVTGHREPLTLDISLIHKPQRGPRSGDLGWQESSTAPSVDGMPIGVCPVKDRLSGTEGHIWHRDKQAK